MGWTITTRDFCCNNLQLELTVKPYCPTRTRLFPKRPKTRTPGTRRLPGPNSLRRRPSQLPPPAQTRTTPRGWWGSRGEHRRTAPAAAGGGSKGAPPRRAPAVVCSVAGATHPTGAQSGGSEGTLWVDVAGLWGEARTRDQESVQGR